MAEVKDLYFLLKEMITSASQGDKSSVLQFNEQYERLVPELYPHLSEPVRFNYDNCRQSCVLGFTLLPLEKERLLQDARARFIELAVPEGYRPYLDA